MSINKSVSALGLVLLLAAGCASPGGITPEQAGRSDVALVGSLREAGFTLARQGVVTHSDLTVAGEAYNIDGGSLQVFEYADSFAARTDAARISPDGQSIAGRRVYFAGTPHWFSGERVIAVYIGGTPEIIDALTRLLGAQFAGTRWPTE